MTDNYPFAIRIAAALIVLVSSGIGLFAAYRKYQTYTVRKLLVDNEYTSKFVGQFHKKEIDRFISGYVKPKCSPTDPNNKEGEEYLADIQQSLFDYMDKNIEIVERSYHLILADTGMGKTMFCLNYFSHAQKKFPDLNFCLVSLSSGNADQIIGSVVNKAETVLIADAFDEDTKGFENGRQRLADLLNIAADFKAVIVTCRSQYFLSDDAIPRETPLPVLIPRQIGQSPTFSLVRSYISPFSEKEIEQYLKKHFPAWQFWKSGARRQAKDLVASVPDLAHRPMLLERLPELAKAPTKSTELYELYDLLVEGWLIRESRWVDLGSLRKISLELALTMYRQFESRKGRITRDEVVQTAEGLLGKSPNWKHLTSRSLLNRDSRGNFKFAHKSILEFLVVKSAIEGDDRGIAETWTSFMKEIFISWGHSDAGRGKWQRARAILSSEEGRRSISPLFDMLGTTAVRGIPNFKRAFERKFTSTGDRFAPASWRQSSLSVENADGRGIVRIKDHEFNLSWSYSPRKAQSDLVPVRLIDALRFDLNNEAIKFPSLEQFLTLVEGLYRIRNEVLSNGALFVLEDKPAKHVHLLAQLNSDVVIAPHLKVLEKSKRLTSTNVYVNCYLTGATYVDDYATKTLVDQLYIEDQPTVLL